MSELLDALKEHNVRETALFNLTIAGYRACLAAGVVLDAVRTGSQWMQETFGTEEAIVSEVPVQQEAA